MERVASDIAYRRLKYVDDWRLVEENQRAPRAAIVHGISRLDAAGHWRRRLPSDHATASAALQRLNRFRASMTLCGSPAGGRHAPGRTPRRTGASNRSSVRRPGSSSSTSIQAAATTCRPTTRARFARERVTHVVGQRVVPRRSQDLAGTRSLATPEVSEEHRGDDDRQRRTEHDGDGRSRRGRTNPRRRPRC